MLIAWFAIGPRSCAPPARAVLRFGSIRTPFHLREVDHGTPSHVPKPGDAVRRRSAHRTDRGRYSQAHRSAPAIHVAGVHPHGSRPRAADRSCSVVEPCVPFSSRRRWGERTCRGRSRTRNRSRQLGHRRHRRTPPYPPKNRAKTNMRPTGAGQLAAGPAGRRCRAGLCGRTASRVAPCNQPRVRRLHAPATPAPAAVQLDLREAGRDPGLDVERGALSRGAAWRSRPAGVPCAIRIEPLAHAEPAVPAVCRWHAWPISSRRMTAGISTARASPAASEPRLHGWRGVEATCLQRCAARAPMRATHVARQCARPSSDRPSWASKSP